MFSRRKCSTKPSASATSPSATKNTQSALTCAASPIFTIDSKDAKDLDDAISVKRTDFGYTLGVHIADVSHYVKEGSAIDEEAINRGTSVYFADRVIPMLPEVLSNGACSLNAGTDKLAFSALIELDKEGRITKYDFKKTIINSKVRGVYSEVNEILDGTASEEILNKYAPVMESLMSAKELADILKANSAARGTMELDSGESKFILDENGICIDIMPRVSGEAEQLIEQMMVTANIAAAKFSLDHKLPFLYRVHGTPDPKRVEELVTLLQLVGVPCKEIVKPNPETQDFAAILDRVRGLPCETLVSQRLLRTMEKRDIRRRRPATSASRFPITATTLRRSAVTRIRPFTACFPRLWKACRQKRCAAATRSSARPLRRNPPAMKFARSSPSVTPRTATWQST